MPTPNAARVGDPIKHSNALLGALTGLAIGIIVGVAAAAFIIATGGLGAIAILSAIGAACTFTSAGFTIGQLLGSIGGSKSGVIGEGARTVFVGAGLPPAARALDKLACGDPPGAKFGWSLVGAVLLGPIGAIAGLAYGISSSAHAGAQIATGSKTVYIEKRNAARVEDETSCSGMIIEGAKTVGIGGEKVFLIPKDQWRGEVPKWLENTIYVVDRVGAVCSLASGLGALRTVGWKSMGLMARTETVFTGVSTTLLGVETGFEIAYGRDDDRTKMVGNIRTGVEVLGGGLSMGANIRHLRAAKPIPPGGQGIISRTLQGGNPPPYASSNPTGYYYDPVASRYKRR